MTDQENWQELNHEEELSETKSLLAYMMEQDRIHYEKYNVPADRITFKYPPEFYNWFKENDMEFGLPFINNDIILDTSTLDIRCEYTTISTIVTLNYAHAYLLLLDHNNTIGVEWFRNRLGDVYNINEHNYPLVSANTINKINRDWYFSCFHHWEYTLRALVNYFQDEGHKIPKYVKKNSELKKTNTYLTSNDSLGSIWMSFVKIYLQHENQESDILFKLNTTIRNCIHNFMVYRPDKNQERNPAISYKSKYFSFQENQNVSFLSPDVFRFLIKEIHAFMINLFCCEKIVEQRYISTYISKFQ